jgi:hypothetical protein
MFELSLLRSCKESRVMGFKFTVVNYDLVCNIINDSIEEISSKEGSRRSTVTIEQIFRHIFMFMPLV